MIKSFIVNKIDKVKNFPSEGHEIYQIDINSWFKSNNLIPQDMNEIRQFIFEEWLSKKIQTSKTKVKSGGHLVIIYDSPTESFISFLNQKILGVFECDSCEIILFE